MLWALVASIAVGGILLVAENAAAVARAGTASLAALLVWSTVGAAVLALVLAWQWFPRPRWTVVLALATGGVAITGLAQQANIAVGGIVATMDERGPDTYLVAPIVEEVLKTAGLLAVLAVPVLRRVGPADGLFYGLLVGWGFQVVESFAYTVAAVLADPGADPSVVVGQILLLRGTLGGLFSHAVWTALVGAAVGHAWAGGPGSRRRWGVAGAVLVGVTVVHGVFNAQPTFNVVAVTAQIVPFVMLLVAVRWTRRVEVTRLVGTAPRLRGREQRREFRRSVRRLALDERRRTSERTTGAAEFTEP